MGYSPSWFHVAESKRNQELTDWRSEMKQANPMAEDMFEKAREAFFGAAKTLPKPSASSAEFLKPRNEPSPKEVTGPSSGKDEAAQPLVR
jgi:hypothetical protein